MFNKLKQISFEKWSVLIIFVINICIVTYFLFNNSFIPVHDFTGGARIHDLHQAIIDGQFPPRWSQNLGYGYGMPLFQFYAPLFFYVAELFHLLNFTITTSLKLTLILSTIIGFVGMYKLGKQVIHHSGGLIAATAFTLAPYHAVNFYVRGAFAEYLAIAIFPWVFFYTVKLFNLKQKHYLNSYIGLTISISAILLTHNVTVLTFFPFWFGFILFLSLFKLKIQKLIFFALSFLHSVAISSFFLLPALLTKSFTRVNEITGGYSDYQLHFIYFRQLFTSNWGYGGSIWGIDDNMSFYLGNDIFLLALISGLIILISVIQKIKSNNLTAKQKTKTDYLTKSKQIISIFKTNKFYQHFFIFSILLLISVSFTSFKSKLLWQYIPLVKFIQFPWRFIGISSFILAILAGYISFFPQTKKYWWIFIIVIIFFNARYFHPKSLIDPSEQYNTNSQYIRDYLSFIIPDYLPPKIDWEHIDPVQQPTVIQGDGEMIITKNTTQRIAVDLNVHDETTIIFNRFVFPNWKFKLDNSEITCEVTDHIYHCPVNSQNKTIQMYWSEKGINKISNIISILGIFTLILITKLCKKNNKVQSNKFKSSQKKYSISTHTKHIADI